MSILNIDLDAKRVVVLELNIDVTRIVTLESNLDARRIVSLNVNLDTARIVARDTKLTINSDTARCTRSENVINADTLRKKCGNFKINADTKRAGYCKSAVNSDTTRSICINSTVISDTLRLISNLVTHTIISDAKRVNYADVIVESDTLRELTVVTTYTINADTSRKLCGKFAFKVDTKRALTVVLDHSFKRADMGVKSIQIQTGVQSLSDRFTIETVGNSFSDVDNFRGEVAGFQFEFEKATASRSTGFGSTTYTVQGRPDMGDLLFANIYMTLPTYWYNTGYIINKSARELCEALGIIANFTDFTPLGIGTFDDKTKSISVKEKTLKGFLDKLFGWSAEFADRQIYYFLRNGKITVQEVGRYTTVYNLDDRSKYIVENINGSEQRIRKFVDYSKNNTDSKDPNKEKPKTPGKNVITPFSNNIGFTGETTFGDANLSYSGGYLMRETTADSDTVYNYEPALHYAFSSNKNVLKEKVTISGTGDSRTTTTYEYDITANSAYASADVDVVLTSESTIVETKSNGAWELESEHKTSHVPIGNGFYGQRVEEFSDDGVVTTVATSISRGSSGGLASMYMVQLVNGYTITPPDPEHPSDPTPVKSFNGELTNGYNIPVAEIPILNGLIDKINWMDGKMEETINVSVTAHPGTDLVDAVGGAIIFEGNLYYPQSTNARVDGRGIKQQISAVRWY